MTQKVLIVEDNPQNLKVAMMALRPGGYEFSQATDGEEAVRVAMEGKPDLILMDIQLPKMDGLEATRRLRREPDFKNTPIIALTAYAMKGDEEKTREAGCDYYLSKPVNTRELRDVVANMLAGQPPR